MNKTDTSIPQGYKNTKIGIIPEDWEVKKLGDIGKFYKGKGISKADLVDEGLNAIRYGELYTVHHIFVKDIFSFISKETAESSFKLENGDILFTGSGETLEEIGKSVAFLRNEETYASGDLIILRPKNKLVNSKFIGFITNHDAFKSQTYKLGQGVSVVHIYSSSLSKTQLPIPPLEEQEKIAECLTTWDNAITDTKKLIAAKKQVKKGLMQQLLTGKKRLAGFTEDWKEVKLGDIGDFKTSSVNKKIEKNEKIVSLVNYMDVYKNTHIDSSITFNRTSVNKSQLIGNNLKVGDILFTPSSETPDDIGHSAVVIEHIPKIVYSYHLVRFRPKKNILNLKFSGYVFNKSEILNEFSRRANGSTRFTLSIKDFKEIHTSIPPIQEQNAIAEILQTADQEIHLLEDKLHALEQQKKGLMQVLLTGKKRLV